MNNDQDDVVVPAEELTANEYFRVFYRGKPFTGVCETRDPEGWVRLRETYRYGWSWGPTWEYTAPGDLWTESHYALGMLHGREHHYQSPGRLEHEALYALGHLLQEREWDRDGNLIKDYQIAQGSAEWQKLQAWRAKLGLPEGTLDLGHYENMEPDEMIHLDEIPESQRGRSIG